MLCDVVFGAGLQHIISGSQTIITFIISNGTIMVLARNWMPHVQRQRVDSRCCLLNLGTKRDAAHWYTPAWMIECAMRCSAFQQAP
jgi:hypothetical protein